MLLDTDLSSDLLLLESHTQVLSSEDFVCSLSVPEVPLLKPSTAAPLQPQTSSFGSVSPAHEPAIFSFKASPESTHETLSPGHRGTVGTPGNSKDDALTVAGLSSAERQRQAEKF